MLRSAAVSACKLLHVQYLLILSIWCLQVFVRQSHPARGCFPLACSSSSFPSMSSPIFIFILHRSSSSSSTTPFASCAGYQTSKCKILLPMPAWIDANVTTTSFPTALLPIAMVGLQSYCFPTPILTWRQIYTVVAAISGALFRNKTVVGANSHWSFLPDLISWLLTLTWMAGVSYSVPIDPHVAMICQLATATYSQYLPTP
jgi:hypothetical protein